LEEDQLLSSFDTDGDGWPNAQEENAGTDPDNVDTDGDGYWDPQDPNPLDPNVPEEKQPTIQPSETPITQAPEDIPNITPTVPTVTMPTSPYTDEMVEEELRAVQAAVKVMMRNNNLTFLPDPVRVPTDDMRHFPDASTRHGSAGVGYVLYLHDHNGDGKPDSNYISFSKTKSTYICDEYGTVTQVTVKSE